MKQKVINTIKNNNLINKGDSIVIGLSGGADSVFLTLILNEIKDEFQLNLKAVHINHMLRGEESNRDMNFCESFCKKLNIPFCAKQFDVETEAKKRGLGIEEAAREIRYECFEREANGGKIATAHNLDDVAETLLFNITRGSGVAGLCSIPIKRDNIIRPIIEISRQEIEEYLLLLGQEFVTDSTNLSDDYSRNKIRHSVVPVLKEINPNFLESVKRLTKSAKMQTAFVENSCKALFEDEISVEKLKNQPEAIVFEAVKKFLSENDILVDFFHLNECVKVLKAGGKCQLPKDFLFLVENDRMTLIKSDQTTEKFEIPFENCVKTPYNKYNAEIVSIEKFKNVYNLFLNDAIDYDKIQNKLVYRNRRSGDKIYLAKRKVNKLLKTVYNELKIPAHLRERLAVLTDGDKIVWAECVGVNSAYAVNKSTKKVLIISKEVDYHK